MKPSRTNYIDLVFNAEQSDLRVHDNIAVQLLEELVELFLEAGGGFALA